MKYAPAEPLLVQYVPKKLYFGLYSRSAAIWSLGHLHEGMPDESLAKQFLERATDDEMPPEFVPAVRAMAAVSIGRMKALSQVARPCRNTWDQKTLANPHGMAMLRRR